MEIKAKNNFYDFESKYSPEGSEHIIPANIPKEVYSLTREISLKCHKIFGCKGISRTDFRWDKEKFLEGLFVLEVNTQPGMTSTSIVPELKFMFIPSTETEQVGNDPTEASEE